MYDIDGLIGAEVWQVASDHVEASRGKRAQARADVMWREVAHLPLRLEPDEPPHRHRVIKGWPDEKDAAKSLTQEIAAVARLVMRS